MSPALGVVGAGSWGTTLAKIAADNGHRVLLWARSVQLCESLNQLHRNDKYMPGVELPSAVTATSDLAEVCDNCTLILLAIPSHAFRPVVRAMGERLRGDHLVVHGTKGLELSGCRRMSEVLREETCLRKIGVLSGPNLARELAIGKPAGSLVASKYDEVAKATQSVLCNSYFRVYSGHDVAGAEIAGAAKNVFALAAGALDGLGLGDNAKSLLLARSLVEMARIGARMGGERGTFWGLAGIGDLVATCASPLSRNHQVGERLAKGETLSAILASMTMVAEGVPTTEALWRYGREHGLELPIVNAVHAVLAGGASVTDVLGELMSREIGAESAKLGDAQ